MGGERTFSELIDLNATRLVVIRDEWGGFSAHSPICASYTLRRGARGGLAGEGRLSTCLAGECVVEVAIRPGVVSKFLGAIAGAKLVEGRYQPLEGWTDDYPHIEITLDVDVGDIGRRGGLVHLFTESQGKFHVPWGANVAGRTWTVPGEEVGRALATLSGPLQRAKLARMMREAEQRTGDGRTEP